MLVIRSLSLFLKGSKGTAGAKGEREERGEKVLYRHSEYRQLTQNIYILLQIENFLPRERGDTQAERDWKAQKDMK